MSATALEALDERALAVGHAGASPTSSASAREMDEAAARRLQPHYIRAFFEAAFTRLGGRIAEREPGRFEITHVPARSASATARSAPVRPSLATSGSRSTRTQVRLDGAPLAELLAPGHPLHDAVDRPDPRAPSRTLHPGHRARRRRRRWRRAAPARGARARDRRRDRCRDQPHRSSAGASSTSRSRAGRAADRRGRAVPRLRPHRRETSRSLRRASATGGLTTDRGGRPRVTPTRSPCPSTSPQVRLHTETRVDATRAAVKERLTRRDQLLGPSRRTTAAAGGGRQEAAEERRPSLPRADRHRRAAAAPAGELERERSLRARRRGRRRRPRRAGGLLRRTGRRRPRPGRLRHRTARGRAPRRRAVLATEERARPDPDRHDRRHSTTRLRHPLDHARDGEEPRRSASSRSRAASPAREVTVTPQRGADGLNSPTATASPSSRSSPTARDDGPLPRAAVRRAQRGLRLRRHAASTSPGPHSGTGGGAYVTDRIASAAPSVADGSSDDRERAQEEADRGGAAAGHDQPRVGAREVDPPRPSVDAAPVVGAPAARGLPRRPLRPARRRPVVASRSVPDRGGAGAERERLFGIIEPLVVWENTTDEAGARRGPCRDPSRSCDGNPPPILDPFAGGGTIPLEAQRLGLEAHACDLNPVAVLINKALIEIPPKFGRPAAGPPRGRQPHRLEGREGSPRTCALRRVDARRGRDAASATSTRRRRSPTGRQKPTSSPGSGRGPSRARTRPAASRCRSSHRGGWARRRARRRGSGRSSTRVSIQCVGSRSGTARQGPPSRRERSVEARRARCLVCGSAVPLEYMRAEGRRDGWARS